MGNQQVDVLELYEDPRLAIAIDNWNLLNFLDENHVDYTLDGKNVGVGFIGVRPCPFCGDARNHFGIHMERKYGSCFICKGYAGPLKLISYYGGMGIMDAFNYLVHDIEDERDVEERVKEIIGIKRKKTNQERVLAPMDRIPSEAKRITKDDIKRNRYLREFLKKRKLYSWNVERYHLYLYDRDILWPVFLNDFPVAYQRRSILLKRYHTSTNLQYYIYDEDGIIPGKPLILVEGFLDYTRIDTFIRAKYSGKISVTTGMLKSISYHQVNRLAKSKVSKMIVMYDNDSWFDYWRVRKVMPFDVDYVILPKGKDPNELSWQELETIFEKDIGL